MKKAIVAALMVVLLTSVGLVGCAGGVVKGSGNLGTEEMNFSGFTRVEVGHAFEVEIVQSASYSVSITADDNLFKYVLVSKTGETLKIELQSGYSYQSITMRAKITMPDLYELDLSGATRGTVQGFSFSHNLILDLSGASSLDMVDMSMTVGDIEFDISGASRVTGDIRITGDADFEVSGASIVELGVHPKLTLLFSQDEVSAESSVNNIAVSASGASRVELTGCLLNNADVNLSGASQGTVNLNGRLDADLSGASQLSYIGEPTMGSIDISTGSVMEEVEPPPLPAGG